MMKFRTELKIKKHITNMNQSDSSLFLGSCFVENIGAKLQRLNFNVEINPFGIIFNPYSIAKILNNSLPNPIDLQNECDIISNSNCFKSYDYHSKFNAKTYNEFISNVTLFQKNVKSHLKDSNYLVITFGTAWVYRLIESRHIVANCHKEPQVKFTKELLELFDLCEMYNKIFKQIIDKNPSIKIILTVSPVRHVKDGIIENSQSKSVLLLLCKALADDFKHNVIYFPSYEIQIDDLRDYRFYKSDLVHPSDMAVDYIFEKFGNVFFSNCTIELNARILKLNKLKAHVFLNPTNKDKEKHQLKIKKLESEISNLYPS